MSQHKKPDPIEDPDPLKDLATALNAAVNAANAADASADTAKLYAGDAASSAAEAKTAAEAASKDAAKVFEKSAPHPGALGYSDDIAGNQIALREAVLYLAECVGIHQLQHVNTLIGSEIKPPAATK